MARTLTSNQLMLLLDIYRGTRTQIDMGTSELDFKILKEEKLISGKITDYQTCSNRSSLTIKGQQIVFKIKTIIQ